MPEHAGASEKQHRTVNKPKLRKLKAKNIWKYYSEP